MNDPLIITFLFLLLLLVGSLLLVLNGRGERGEVSIFVGFLLLGFLLSLQFILLLSCHNHQILALNIGSSTDLEL